MCTCSKCVAEAELRQREADAIALIPESRLRLRDRAAHIAKENAGTDEDRVALLCDIAGLVRDALEAARAEEEDLWRT